MIVPSVRIALFLYTIFHITNIQTELTNSKPKNKSIFLQFHLDFRGLYCIIYMS